MPLDNICGQEGPMSTENGVVMDPETTVQGTSDGATNGKKRMIAWYYPDPFLACIYARMGRGLGKLEADNNY